MRKTYNKLVRDKIPILIAANGEEALTRIVSGKEYEEFLLRKDLEESGELREAKTAAQRLEELADKLEVLCALTLYYGLTMEDVEEKRQEKERDRGGFFGKIVLIETG